jgi:cbb3-type cytochrome oxidase maturation protein
MSVLILLISTSLLIALVFLGGFIWSLHRGQWEDTQTPPVRMLFDDKNAPPTNTDKNHSSTA